LRLQRFGVLIAARCPGLLFHLAGVVGGVVGDGLGCVVSASWLLLGALGCGVAGRRVVPGLLLVVVCFELLLL